MKKLLFLVLFVVNVIAQAQTITIGEGSEMTAQVPFNSFYNYSYTEQIFLANEIEDPVGSRMLYQACNIDAVSLLIDDIKAKLLEK